MIVVGSGKATLAIAAALERILGDRLDGGAVVVRDGEDAIALERIEVLVADHPLPSERSDRRRPARSSSSPTALGERRPRDRLRSPAAARRSRACPPRASRAAEKRRLHELLLGSGAPIIEVNTVRKHVSAIKGGRLARARRPGDAWST